MPALLLPALAWIGVAGAGVVVLDRANDELRDLAVTAAVIGGGYLLVTRGSR